VHKEGRQKAVQTKTTHEQVLRRYPGGLDRLDSAFENQTVKILLSGIPQYRRRKFAGFAKRPAEASRKDKLPAQSQYRIHKKGNQKAFIRKKP
jgi:hypothetical protein